jgi:hypothetical protein
MILKMMSHSPMLTTDQNTKACVVVHLLGSSQSVSCGHISVPYSGYLSIMHYGIAKSPSYVLLNVLNVSPGMVMLHVNLKLNGDN